MMGRNTNAKPRQLKLWQATSLIIAAALALSASKIYFDIQLIRSAFLYGYAPYTFDRTVHAFIAAPSQFADPAWNHILHADGLSTPSNRTVTMPNASTIYSIAALDLQDQPALLSVPDEQNRYFSIAFLDVFTDNFYYIGTRGTNGIGGEFVIASPDSQLRIDPPLPVIEAPTEKVWMLVRVLVEGPEDLEAAKKFQRSISLKSNKPPRQPTASASFASLVPTVDSFLEGANRALSWAPAGHPHKSRGKRFEAVGLGGDAAPPSAYERFLWRLVITKGTQALENAVRNQNFDRGDWTRSPENVGRYGDDDRLRSAVALIGLGALEAEEALYFSTRTDSSGQPLEGTRGYYLEIPPNGLPAEAFWSLTMYERAPDGRYFLVENPINRYMIGNWTKGLVRQPDGSTQIHIGAGYANTDPNWLPAPDGAFLLTLRLYMPTEEALDPAWLPPAIQAR